MTLGLTVREHERVARIDQLMVIGAAGVDELVAFLVDASWTVRRAAVRALAALGDEAVEPLLTRLREHRTNEREIAALVDALSMMHDATSTQRVAALAGTDLDAAVLSDLAAILGRRGAREAVPQLVALLAHPDDNVAVAAIEALGRIDGGAHPALVNPLTTVVGKRNFFRTFAALQVLARSANPRAITPLAELVLDPMFGAEAAGALGRTGSPLAVAPLAQLITRPGATAEEVRLAGSALSDLLVRAEATGALVHAAARVQAELATSSKTILAALTGCSVHERVALVRVVGYVGGPGVLSALAHLVLDPDAGLVAAEAVTRLGRGAPKELVALVVAADSPSRAALLPAIGARAAATTVRAMLIDSDVDVRARACEALARLGDTTSVPALFKLLADSNPRVVHAATAAIHSLGTPATPSLALAALGSPLPAVRKQALRILAYLGAPATFDAVLAATSDPDPRIGELAVIALGTIDDSRADDQLATLVTRGGPLVRAATMRAAGQRGGPAMISVLQRGLRDDDSWVRYYACQGLGRLEVVDATPQLVERLADATPHVRIAAIEALARAGTPAAWQALASTARSADADERRAALVGISSSKRPESLGMLLAAATDPDVATQLIAIDGLARRADPAALVALSTAAHSETPELVEATVTLLAARPERAATDVLVELAVASAPDHPVHRALSHSMATGQPGATEQASALGARLATADDLSAPTIAGALARAAVPVATAALLTALTAAGPSGRRAAAIALAGTGEESARAAVARSAGEDPDPDVRRVAAAAIAR